MKINDDLLEEKIVAIIRNVPDDKLDMLAKALFDGGIRFMEVTLNSDNALEGIERLSKTYKNKAYVGAGTVLDIDMAKAALAAGAEFLVTPNTDIEVLRHCSENNILILPGAVTPTEIVTCIKNGCKFVKIFPASSLGPKYIKELTGPLNNVNLIPVGGVSLENIPEFKNNGAKGFGIGGSLCNLELIHQNKFNEITEIARDYVNVAKN